MNKIRTFPRIKVIVILITVFSVMLLLNHFTPYLADDFTFSYSFADRNELSSPFILLRSLYYHYMEWSGRIVVKFFAQLFTISPKWVFDLCNAAVFTALGLVLSKLGDVFGYATQPLVLCFAYLSLWLVSPAFGQTSLWMCGSCNYLWSTAGCLTFLLPWRALFMQNSRQYPAIPMLISGIAAGWLYENTSAGMLVCMVLCLVWCLIRTHQIPRWALAAFIGSFIGYLLLILAPGNAVRTDDSAGIITDSLWVYILRIRRACVILLQYGWPLLLVFAVLLFLLIQSSAEKTFLAWPCILFISGLAAHFAMILSPVYYLRSTHGPFTFFTAACCACLIQFPEGRILYRARRFCAAAGVWAGIVLIFACYDIIQYNRLYALRDIEIREQISAGQINIKTYAITPNTFYCAAWGLPDIRENEDWISITRSMWYGLDGLGLKTGVQGTITADSDTPVHYDPLLGLTIGFGKPD